MNNLELQELLPQLDKAVERNELRVEYQVQYSSDQRKIIGVEALVRWVHKKYGIIGPNYFIDYAEKSNLINKITFWVLESVIKSISEWRTYIEDIPLVSLNLSALIFCDHEFIDLFKKLIQKYNIDPKKIAFEITETQKIKKIKETIEFLNEIKSLGVKIVLDDFGTGYSNYFLLMKLPIDIIKIDKNFLDNLNSNEKCKIIFRSIIELVNNLNLNVIVEGVESKKQFYYLTSLGYSYFQGYLFSKPLPNDLIIKLLKNGRFKELLMNTEISC